MYTLASDNGFISAAVSGAQKSTAAQRQQRRRWRYDGTRCLNFSLCLDTDVGAAVAVAAAAAVASALAFAFAFGSAVVAAAVLSSLVPHPY